LCQQTLAQLQATAQLPSVPTYRFETAAPLMPVLKSRARGVVSLQHGRFVAVEVMRADRHGSGAKPQRCSALARLVPRRSAYAFDLIAQVGEQTFLQGHTLAQVQQTLQAQCPHSIPLSTLQDLKMKFLFYLGLLHHQAAPQLKAALQQRGHIQWAIDGTLEPGTAVFFAVKEPEADWLLACRKIPTENLPDIQASLQATALTFGEPEGIWHDLSPVIIAACPAALPHVAHFVCHYHLVSDVGQDLYQAPQAALLKGLQALRLQARLTEQRRGQTEQLQVQVRQRQFPLVLQALWQGQKLADKLSPTLSREILLACHLWLLDYASEGRRQGFPFDPHLLYYHRRVVRVVEALGALRQQSKLWAAAPPALRNFQQLLSAYLADPQIQQSAAWFEKAYRVFEKFRSVLRLATPGPAPVHEAYGLAAPEVGSVQTDLTAWREDLRRQERQEDLPAQDRKLVRIVLTHLDRYWPALGLAEGVAGGGGLKVRTTNSLETHWTQGKRMCRQIHGRSHLTRDFAALPAEFMLVPNLRRQTYQQLVLGGGLDCLANKFSDLCLPPGGFHQWRQQQRPQFCARLPKRLLREEQFLDKLLNFWPNQSAASPLKSDPLSDPTDANNRRSE